MNTNIKFIVVNFNYICFIDEKRCYQFVVNLFIYVMFDTRFDIVYVVLIVNRYTFNFNQSY